jgi:glutamyl-tRNA synthetase/glutamyl-Q tRNA(Asp) synthetase
VVSRFAPAPTGYLHLGHVLNAIYVWGIARAAKGRVLVRLEDHDRQRSRPEFERAIIEDLRWLGFLNDEPIVRQADRNALYQAALDRLRDRQLVYACGCSRRDILESSAVAEAEEARYPGTCAAKQLPEREGLGLRVRMGDATERFDDLRHGPQAQRPARQCGDLLVRDRDGNWTYQFAVVVDDIDQGITHVIRGDDLLASTGRQLQLARLLGRRDPPLFLHHPLIMKDADQKLSKSDGDTGVRDLRDRGWTAAQVIGYAALLGGVVDRPRLLHAAEVEELFGR